jgi:hypothetical protein
LKIARLNIKRKEKQIRGLKKQNQVMIEDNYKERLQYERQLEAQARKHHNEVEELKEVKTWENGHYTYEFRETAMDLSALGISSTKIGSAIEIVCQKLAHKTVTRIPNPRTIQFMTREMGIIAQVHLALEIEAGKPGITIGKDSTTFKKLEIGGSRLYFKDGDGENITLFFNLAAMPDHTAVEQANAIIQGLEQASNRLKEVGASTNGNLSIENLKMTMSMNISNSELTLPSR